MIQMDQKVRETTHSAEEWWNIGVAKKGVKKFIFKSLRIPYFKINKMFENMTLQYNPTNFEANRPSPQF